MCKTIIIVFIVTAMGACSTLAASETATQLLEKAVSALESSHEYSDSKFGESLQQLITEYPNSTEAPTARVLLASYYIETSQEKNQGEILNLCNQIIADKPGTWQCALALITKLALFNLQKQSAFELELDLSTIRRRDLTPPNNINDPMFARIITAVGGSKNDSLMDAFHASACYIYIAQNRKATAQEHAAAISNLDIRKKLESQIADSVK